MCGIAGIFNKTEKVKITELKKMTDSLIHRGPDGEGHWVDNNIGIGHRRLSIIDLSENASQPMHSFNNKYVIVLNGEIYNYIELKEQLIKQGYKFKSESDTEVLLNLYIEKGVDCLNDIDGMFAFAIFNKKEKTLFCARDRFGEKPFYYYYIPGKTFVFGSEIKVFKQLNISLSLLPHRIAWYFNDKYALLNTVNKEETFYEKIKSLESGHYLLIDNDIKIIKKKYWDIDLKKLNRTLNFSDATLQFYTLLYNSVSKTLRSDVPVGSSLSGGLDSSSIVCIISDILKKTNQEQKTFSARFENFSKDEGKYIKEVANNRNIKDYHVWPNQNNLLDELNKFITHQEEPVGTANQFSQWMVMKLAKENNVTVLLDGQGADEIITGYAHYYDAYFNELYLSSSSLFNKELDEYIKNFNPEYVFTPKYNSNKTLLKFNIKKSLAQIYRNYIKHYWKIKQYNGILNAEFAEHAFNSGGYPYYDYNEGLNKALYYDAKMGKMEVLLRYGDKNSMAHSREVRLPFLDKTFVEFVFALPSSFKINNGWSKFILRTAMKELLPEKITWRKDKIGYATPQDRWLKNKKMETIVQDSLNTLKKHRVLNSKVQIENIADKKWQIINIATLIDSFI